MDATNSDGLADAGVESEAKAQALAAARRVHVVDAVAAQIFACDPQRTLRGDDIRDVLTQVADTVMASMTSTKRFELDYEDRAYIARSVLKFVSSESAPPTGFWYRDLSGAVQGPFSAQQMTEWQSAGMLPLGTPVSRQPDGMFTSLSEDYFAETPGAETRSGPPQRKSKPTRFQRFDRVVCNIGDTGWASGTIQAINEADPQDTSGTLPYIVVLDGPNAANARLISVPRDDSANVRAEVCFGVLADALVFTLFCLPLQQTKKRRFRISERVACAIEDSTGDYSVWAAGTVLEVDRNVQDSAKELFPAREWKGNAGVIPYRVRLDTGTEVLVHRDEHWLVRDLVLQPEGPRQGVYFFYFFEVWP